jgi:hypothetical protein
VAALVVALAALAAAAVALLVPADAATSATTKPSRAAGAPAKPSMTVIAGCVAKAGITSLESLEQLSPKERDALESCLESDGYAKAAIAAAKACAKEQGVGTSPDALEKLSKGQLDRLKQCVAGRLQLNSV